MRLIQSPQYFDARRHRKIRARNIQADKSDEFARCLDLACSWTPSMLGDEAFAAIRHRVALLARKK